MAVSLKQKAARGLVWRFLGQGGAQLIQFISGIYIARLLSPEDYGLIGMLAIFLAISQMFINSGFRTALIQKGKDVTHDHYNVVFLFNITISIIFYALIYLSAPVLAEFYNEPKLTNVARVLGLNLIFLSAGIIHQTILEMRLNFRTQAKVRLIAILSSVIVGIYLAKTGYGVWALVFMMIIESFVRSAMFWAINKWKPTLQFNLGIFRELFTKGLLILLSGSLRSVSENVFPIYIGKVYATADVGFYSQARKLQKRFVDFITMSFQSVMYPVQSLMKNNEARLKNAVRKNTKILSMIALPGIVGILVLAEPIIELLLTSKWASSVYYLQVLSLSGLFFIAKVSINSYILPLGKFRLSVKLNFLQTISLILFILIGIVLGLPLHILVLAKILQEVVGFSVAAFYAKKLIAYKYSQILIDLLPSSLLSTALGLVLWVMTINMDHSFFSLGLQLITGGLLYILMNFVFNKPTLNESLMLFQNLLANKSTQRDSHKTHL